jgi:hypothetical protein
VQIICRDLWALHLSLLPSPPPAEPLFHQQATQGQVDERTSEEIDAQGEKASSDLSNPSPPHGDDIEDNADIDELLRELSESSSSEDDKDDDPGQPRPKPEGSGRKLKPFSRNGPASNIALLMVACWTLRLPVMYLDLIRLDCRMGPSRLTDVTKRVHQVDRVLRTSLPGGAASPTNDNGLPPHETQCAGALTGGKKSWLLCARG